MKENKKTNQQKPLRIPRCFCKGQHCFSFHCIYYTTIQKFYNTFCISFSGQQFFKLCGLRAFSTSAIFPVWLSPKMGHHPKTQLLPHGCSPILHCQPSFLIVSQGRPSERKKKEKSRFVLNIQKAFCGFL